MWLKRRNTVEIRAALLGSLAGLWLTLQASWPSDMNRALALPGLAAPVAGTLLGAAAGYLAWHLVARVWRRLEAGLLALPAQRLITCVVGFAVGMWMVTPLAGAFPDMDGQSLGVYVPFLVHMVGALGGAYVALERADDLLELQGTLFSSAGPKKTKKMPHSNYKILDTSVIIDGRIADVCAAGFVEGVLILPSFVLEELRHIADSPDVLRRNRGRRGLDILNKLKKDPHLTVKVHDKQIEAEAEVDTEIVRLAKSLGAKIVTNDYNLNKVAELQGVEVLNINELSNALKPVVLPGESMTVRIVKEGKECGQGIGYLDDGTMIVVDDGEPYIGSSISVEVTSVLQTAAGRMIFAKPRALEQAL